MSKSQGTKVPKSKSVKVTLTPELLEKIEELRSKERPIPPLATFIRRLLSEKVSELLSEKVPKYQSEKVTSTPSIEVQESESPKVSKSQSAKVSKYDWAIKLLAKQGYIKASQIKSEHLKKWLEESDHAVYLPDLDIFISSAYVEFCDYDSKLGYKCKKCGAYFNTINDFLSHYAMQHMKIK